MASLVVPKLPAVAFPSLSVGHCGTSSILLMQQPTTNKADIAHFFIRLGGLLDDYE